jgi:hypothetical protein
MRPDQRRRLPKLPQSAAPAMAAAVTLPLAAALAAKYGLTWDNCISHLVGQLTFGAPLREGCARGRSARRRYARRVKVPLLAMRLESRGDSFSGLMGDVPGRP